MSDTKLQNQEAQRTTSRVNAKKTKKKKTARQIIFILQKTKTKES